MTLQFKEVLKDVLPGIAEQLWEFVHNAIAHPLLAIGIPYASQFHDWTAKKISEEHPFRWKLGKDYCSLNFPQIFVITILYFFGIIPLVIPIIAWLYVVYWFSVLFYAINHEKKRQDELEVNGYACTKCWAIFEEECVCEEGGEE